MIQLLRQRPAAILSYIIHILPAAVSQPYPVFFLCAANSRPVASARSPAGKRSSTMVEPMAFSDMYVRRVKGSKASPMNQATPAM